MHSCEHVVDGRLTGACILRFERGIPERLIDLDCCPMFVFYNTEAHQVGFFKNDELAGLPEDWVYCGKANTPFFRLENNVDISFALMKFSKELCLSDGDINFFIDKDSDSGLILALI